MKLAVVGSRTFYDYDLLERCLLRYFSLDDLEILSGGARGTDALAARFAREHGLALRIIEADWERLGRVAGPVRNSRLVQEAEVLVAFWDGRSRGTRDSIAKARRAGKRVLVLPCRESAG